MARFEPGSSGVGSNHSANCATTTAQKFRLLTLLRQQGMTIFKVISSFITEYFCLEVFKISDGKGPYFG